MTVATIATASSNVSILTYDLLLNCLLTELKGLKVEVKVSHDLEARGEYGTYDPMDRSITYSFALLRDGDQDMLLETIAHEATHSAQHYLGVNSYALLGVTPTYSAVERVNNDQVYAEKSDYVRMLEFEAFTLEKRPCAVLNILRQLNGKKAIHYQYKS